jgi:hypothetical protein
MSIFDRSFLITAGIVTVICGLICYYLHTRMRELELALVKQNQVLSSFIANVQHEFRMGGRASASAGPTNELASAEAIASMVEAHRKIVVVDNDSDDESVSDNESVSDDSDDESVSDNESVSDKLVIYDMPTDALPMHLQLPVDAMQLPNDIHAQEIHAQEIQAHDIKIIDISSSNLVNADIELLSDDESEESDSESESEPVTVTVKAPEKITVEKKDGPAPLPLQGPAPVPAQGHVPVQDLRVDELRKLVLDKGLVSKEDVKKLKKNELLAALKK